MGDKLYTSAGPESYAIRTPGFMPAYDKETGERIPGTKVAIWKFIVTKVSKHYVTIEYKYYKLEGTVRLKKRKQRLYIESLREKYSGVTIDCVNLKIAPMGPWTNNFTLYRVVDEKENIRKTDGVERLFR